MSHRANRRASHRQEHSCRVWWHTGFGKWVWRCWDCIEPGQIVNGSADTQPQAFGALEAHFRSGQGLTHNAIRATGMTTQTERWAA